MTTSIFEIKTGKNQSQQFITKQLTDGTTLVYSRRCRVNANGIAQTTGMSCQYDSRSGY